MNSFKEYLLEAISKREYTLRGKSILLKLSPTSNGILFKVAQSRTTLDGTIVHAFSQRIGGISKIEISPKTGKIVSPKGATYTVVD